jgi:catechol 2,3-dioxygenase-like lactoylglutathione lyase family enzyme
VPDTDLGSFQHVTVGVADLDVALALWVEQFGFQVVARSEGPDGGLAQLWSLQPQDISRQAMVRTPGQDYGMVHFVEFVDPDPPVRAGAEVYDMVPKNLDISVRDLPARFAEMVAAGQVFRTETYKEASSGSGGRFREGQMKGHDDTNIVLLEVVGGGLPEELYTPQGYAGVTALIGIVPDAPAEKRFYAEALGLTLKSESLLTGPEIEAMIGLPPGSGLDVSMMGGDQTLGVMEIIEYQGVRGTNRYPQAKPKALGTLHITYMTGNLAAVKARLAAAGVPATEYGNVSTLFGSGEAIAVTTPAGMRIEIHERAAP